MADYSFMKSGSDMIRTNPVLDENIEQNIMSMLTLFTSNALINASEYSKICGRNGITKEDIKYGLIFEVFEFIKNPNLLADLNEVEEELLKEDTDNDEDWEDVDENDNIFPENKLDEFSRIDIHNVKDKDKDFVTKYHNYYDSWGDWEPTNQLETILKDAIDKH